MGSNLLILSLQLAGLALAAVVVMSFLGNPGRPRRLAALTAAAIVVAAVLAARFPPAARDSAAELRGLRKLSYTKDAQTSACLMEPALPSPAFIAFLQRRMAPDSRFVLHLSKRAIQLSAQLCIDFVLLPRVQVDDAADADWIVFFGAVPPEWRKRVRRPSADVTPFAPDHVLVRVGPDAR